MKRNKNILLVGLLLVLATTVFAQPMRKNMQRPARMLGERPRQQQFEQLNLTDEQEKTMEDMRIKHQKELIPLQSQVKSKRLDFKQEMNADNPNQAKLESLVEDMGNIRTEIQKKRVAHRLAMRNILTKEQREIMDNNRRGFRGKRGMRGQRGCMNWDGPGREGFFGPMK